eukprot:TRINITY_DN67080_c0_g1_i2.p1 TRINITY_DN67080_c0_g1~~TRINITY_DN67080_c0_g1_i2.p1  ORF type:complete len:535 (+),score=128.81 TRINITY_DN67080_c0_g1_i2:123-1727(+)
MVSLPPLASPMVAFVGDVGRRAKLLRLAAAWAATLGGVVAIPLGEPPCGAEDFHSHFEYLVKMPDFHTPLVQTSMLITRCLEEKPLLRVLFHPDGGANAFPKDGWRGLLFRYIQRWQEWSSAGRPQPEEQDELVVGLEILRASAEALQRFAETAFAMSLKLLVAQSCSLSLAVPAGLQESVLRLAAVASAEISAALALLKPTGGVASSKRSATWVPLLGTPTSIVLQHAGSALDVLKTVTAIHRHTLYPEKVFEFLYDLARHVATTKCRLQAHLSAYLQVAMAEASERCLIARGAVAFGDMSSSAAAAGFRETFGGLLDDGGACPSGLDTTPTSGADAEEAAAPAAPDYIFYPACCRRFHVLSSLLSERLGADEATVRIVEVGVRLAHTTEELLQRFPRLELVAVDPYLGADGDKIHEWVSGRLQQYSDRARLLRLRSEEAAKNLSEEAREKPFDLVFVDGDHSFDHVVQDIELWTPMIRGGGILAGHDVFLPAFDVHAALRYLRRPRVPVVEDVLEKNHSIHIGADHTFFWHV